MATFEHYEQGTPSWIELMTPDQSAALKFYGELFGWSYDDHDLGEMGHYYIPTMDGDEIGGVSGQMPGMEGHPAVWGVYLAVDDVDAATAKVEAAGGKVEAGPFDVNTNGRMSAIQDPTGARVGLWQARDTIGTQRANEPGTPTWNECVTSDVARAAKFYADVLGMGSEAMDMGEAGTYTVLTNVAGRQIGGAMDLAMLPPGTPAHWNVYFNVEDVDESVAEAERLGGKPMVPAMDVPGVGRMAMVSDPQGATFWVMSGEAAA
ncbi:MAG TPA: VOC family protein [Nocardioides sp.]|uniref:VOC family protein n=1 Tax=Nocardioides sp. TaxID=35761 RepID=UPI002F3EB08C